MTSIEPVLCGFISADIGVNLVPSPLCPNVESLARHFGEISDHHNLATIWVSISSQPPFIPTWFCHEL
jgi:hypothetical protein